MIHGSDFKFGSLFIWINVLAAVTEIIRAIFVIYGGFFTTKSKCFTELKTQRRQKSGCSKIKPGSKTQENMYCLYVNILKNI